MLARVEIENREGVSLLRYKNPMVETKAGTPTFSLVEKKGGLLYKGFFLLSEDQYAARSTLKALIRDIAVDTEALIIRKHATVYAYIDNYLTTKSPVFSIPRKRTKKDVLQIGAMLRRKVYVEVADKIFQRSTHGTSSTTAYGQIRLSPTEDVGPMSLKIDSRSLCGIRNIQFNCSVSTSREGITTLVTCPSQEMSVLSYTFLCSENALPAVKVTLIDSRTLEVLFCGTEGGLPEVFSASICFDFNPGGISIECQHGKHEYLSAARTLNWTLTRMSPSATLTIHTSEPHRSSGVLKYRYTLHKQAISSVLVNSLSSDADENWIKYTTEVIGLIRISE